LGGLIVDLCDVGDFFEFTVDADELFIDVIDVEDQGVDNSFLKHKFNVIFDKGIHNAQVLSEPIKDGAHHFFQQHPVLHQLAPGIAKQKINLDELQYFLD